APQLRLATCARPPDRRSARRRFDRGAGAGPPAIDAPGCASPFETGYGTSVALQHPRTAPPLERQCFTVSDLYDTCHFCSTTHGPAHARALAVRTRAGGSVWSCTALSSPS